MRILVLPLFDPSHVVAILAHTPLRYRSKKRVPTHYALLHGGAMSICRLVQAAGRAHGEQASRLRANGFDQVTLLTLAHDFDTIKNYPSFLEVHCPPAYCSVSWPLAHVFCCRVYADDQAAHG